MPASAPARDIWSPLLIDRVNLPACASGEDKHDIAAAAQQRANAFFSVQKIQLPGGRTAPALDLYRCSVSFEDAFVAVSLDPIAGGWRRALAPLQALMRRSPRSMLPKSAPIFPRLQIMAALFISLFCADETRLRVHEALFDFQIAQCAREGLAKLANAWLREELEGLSAQFAGAPGVAFPEAEGAGQA